MQGALNAFIGNMLRIATTGPRPGRHRQEQNQLRNHAPAPGATASERPHQAPCVPPPGALTRSAR
jgi:hypothetical protein